MDACNQTDSWLTSPRAIIGRAFRQLLQRRLAGLQTIVGAPQDRALFDTRWSELSDIMSPYSCSLAGHERVSVLCR